MKLEAADIAGADDSQKLAILECMMLAMFADGVVTPDELRRFDAIAEALPWGMERPVLVALLRGAQERMRTLSTGPAILDFVAGLAQRVTSQVLREKIVYTMATLAESDGKLHQFEKNILGVMVVSFNIPSDRVELIKAAVATRPE